ncbi:MAG: hypothetical protein Cpurp_02050 [Chlorogloea purpurea SAG 13.99]|nr:hypothetical protein [Chlorogloea purpurea SAG 13.99]
MSQSQVDGIEAILNYWLNCPLVTDTAFKTNWDVRSINWLAYILATVYHETNRKMKPIHEYGDDDYFTRLYEGRKDLGNVYFGDGAKFHGRGLVQITGRANYRKFTGILRKFFVEHIDLTECPNYTLKEPIALAILFYGSVMGTFTGKALKHYLGDTSKGQMSDYINARRIINGLDRATLIKSYAVMFEKGLR